MFIYPYFILMVIFCKIKVKIDKMTEKDSIKIDKKTAPLERRLFFKIIIILSL